MCVFITGITLFTGSHANTTRRKAHYSWPVYCNCSEAGIFSVIFRPISFYFASTNVLYDEIWFIWGIWNRIDTFFKCIKAVILRRLGFFQIRWAKILSHRLAKLILHSSRRFGLQELLEHVGVSLGLLGTWLMLECRMILNCLWRSGESKL